VIEDRELDIWREQWRSAAEPLPEIQRKIKWQNLRFMISNVAAAILLIAVLIFAMWAVRQHPSRLRIGWAVGISVLVFVSAGCRLWVQRGTWRAESQSTRAFVELRHRRLMARLRLIRMANYLLPAWLVFCAALAAVNWNVIGPDVRAHPTEWLWVLGSIFLMVLASFLWLAWCRRRKLAELRRVERTLDEMQD
jgi:O-antigen/teichoic acid export membrane protein